MGGKGLCLNLHPDVGPRAQLRTWGLEDKVRPPTPPTMCDCEQVCPLNLGLPICTMGLVTFFPKCSLKN